MCEIPKGSKISVIGGDARMLYCGEKLAEFGYEVALFGFDKAEENTRYCTKCTCVDDALCSCSAVILPLPLSNDNITLNMPLSDASITLAALFSLLDNSVPVFAGGVTSEVKRLSEKFGLKIEDYFDREELKIANAVLTAESAIEIAMASTDFSITDYPVLVVGYGRIGKALCRLLKAMGCSVFASARKDSDKAWIRAFGYSSVDTSRLKECIHECRLIFNTVPYVVLDGEVLSCLDKDSLVIDLASKPGGVDFERAKEQKLKVIWALALPGKKLKISAGKAIADTLINIFHEEA